MKIGIEAQRLFREKKHGMEIVALQTIRHLQKLAGSGNVYFVLAKEDTGDDCLQETPDVKIIRTVPKPYPLWEQWLLPRLAKKLNLSLLHCMANTAPLYCPVPLVITIHDLIYLDKIEFKGSAYQNFGNLYRRCIVPRVAQKATAIITVSEFAKKDIAQRLRIPANKISVVYNGVSENFKMIKDVAVLASFRKKYGLPEKYFLHFANKAPRKNTKTVLQAHAAYCTATLQPLPLVLTSCSNDFLATLLQQAGVGNTTGNIVPLDYIAAADLALLYNTAAIFLYPSISEGFGMPVIEAMACGTPVITSNTTSLPEVAGNAAFLVDPENVDQLTNAMMTLANDQFMYSNLQVAGLKNALRFTWENAAQKTAEVYAKIKNDKFR